MEPTALATNAAMANIFLTNILEERKRKKGWEIKLSYVVVEFTVDVWFKMEICFANALGDNALYFFS